MALWGNSAADHPEIAAMIRAAFPLSISEAVGRALRAVPEDSHPVLGGAYGPLSILGESVSIPHRIYSPEPGRIDIKSLEPYSQLILAAIYSRHHDGYVRQNHITDLLPSSEAWIPPFVFLLASEYVVEIIEHMLAHLDEIPRDPYIRFASDNPDFMRFVKSRIVSYWACYYRGPRFKEYPGFIFLDAFGLWRRQDIPRHWVKDNDKQPRTAR